MSKSSKFVTLIMVIVLLLVATAPAFADEPPPVVTREVYNGPIDQWTLPANSCPTVPLGLTGDGQRRTVTVTRTYDDGHVVVTVRDVVRDVPHAHISQQGREKWLHRMHLYQLSRKK